MAQPLHKLEKRMADETLRNATAEAAKLALKMGSATADIVSFMAELGEELPLLQPALGTLAIICQKVETVRNLPEESAALHARCTYLTACVIVKCRRVSSETNVAPLDACLKEVAKCVERCGQRGRLSRVMKASHDKAEIARLNASLDRLSGDIGLASIATVEQKVDTILVSEVGHVLVLTYSLGQICFDTWLDMIFGGYLGMTSIFLFLRFCPQPRFHMIFKLIHMWQSRTAPPCCAGQGVEEVH